jgi:hypothetical protein
LIPKYEHNLFLGDFNVNLLINSRETTDFRDKLDDHDLTVISSEPTHFQGESATLIDLCLTSFPEDIGMFSQIPFPGIRTGHDLLYGYIHVCDVPENGLEPPNPRFFRDYKALTSKKHVGL